MDQLDFFDIAAATFTHAADGNDEDFTISQTGAQDASLILSSTGTGADALQISTSAGGIDITVSGGAAGEDIDISTDTSINLTATENAASNIYIRSNGGTSETMKIHVDQGNGDSSLDIDSDAGGIDIDAAKSIAITSSENTTDAIQINASAGGINITASNAAATEDIRLIATGSSIGFTSTEAAADAIRIDTLQSPSPLSHHFA